MTLLFKATIPEPSLTPAPSSCRQRGGQSRIRPAAQHRPRGTRTERRRISSRPFKQHLASGRKWSQRDAGGRKPAARSRPRGESPDALGREMPRGPYLAGKERGPCPGHTRCGAAAPLPRDMKSGLHRHAGGQWAAAPPPRPRSHPPGSALAAKAGVLGCGAPAPGTAEQAAAGLTPAPEQQEMQPAFLGLWHISAPPDLGEGYSNPLQGGKLHRCPEGADRSK